MYKNTSQCSLLCLGLRRGLKVSLEMLSLRNSHKKFIFMCPLVWGRQSLPTKKFRAKLSQPLNSGASQFSLRVGVRRLLKMFQVLYRTKLKAKVKIPLGCPESCDLLQQWTKKSAGTSVYNQISGPHPRWWVWSMSQYPRWFECRWSLPSFFRNTSLAARLTRSE